MIAVPILLALAALAVVVAARNRRRGRRDGPDAMFAPQFAFHLLGFEAGPGAEPAGPGLNGQSREVSGRGAEPPEVSFAAAPGAPPSPDAEQRVETLRVLLQMRTLKHGDSLRKVLAGQVILSHMPYARYIAALYKSTGEPDEVTGAIAEHSLAVAVDGFDPESGVDFLAYATPVILREVRSRHRAGRGELRTPRRARHLADALPASADRFTRKTGRSPTISELASALGVRGEEIVEALDTALGCSETPSGSLGQIPGGDHEHLDSGGPDLGFTEELSEDQVKLLLAPLPERNKRIVMMRYLRGMSDAQIGAELNISPVHVQRLLTQAMGALLA